GPNGAGKSTLMRAIMRLIPYDGTVAFAGQSLGGSAAHELAGKGIMLVPEGRGILGPLTVLENLELGGYSRLGRDSRQEIREELESVFELFPILKERRSQAAGSLSGGQQQMLAVGRALMARPRLLLLDEPSLGLAPRVTAEIFRALGDLNKSGLTVLVVEQKAPLVLELANRAYVLRTGEVVSVVDPRTHKEPGELARVYLGKTR
ncbi:MAG: ABC transporter ATP-binding protein, partial [Candidatus Eiseniibacteriota bacterium]